MSVDPMTPRELRRKIVEARRFLLWTGQALDLARGPIDLARAERLASISVSMVRSLHLELESQTEGER